MAKTVLTYTVFRLGDCQLHQLHTQNGKLFVMGEVAVELFQESPTAFLAELRKSKHQRSVCAAPEVLQTISELGLPVENTFTASGVVLLPAVTVEALMLDKRRLDLVQPFRLALLKLASQEAARLMAAGEYELALPAALDAVQQGQALFKPAPALQLFPLYLLAAQANLGLRRAKQCEDFLALASWLTMKEPALTSHVMRSQLNRLYGQLYAFQGRTEEALRAFAEDVYHCSCEYGARDVRTSLGYYNLAKCFQADGHVDRAMSCNDQLVNIWATALEASVLGLSRQRHSLSAAPSGAASKASAAPAQQAELPVGRLQLMEVVDMLQDVARLRASALGPQHAGVADAHFVSALALTQLQERQQGLDQLDVAQSIYSTGDEQHAKLLNMVRQQLLDMPLRTTGAFGQHNSVGAAA